MEETQSNLEAELQSTSSALDRDTIFMKRAITLSLEKMMAGAGGPFGAVIVKEGKIIAEGWNQVTTLNDPTAHAEVVAIREACRKMGHFELQGCTLYTSCEPCPMCLGASYWSRVDRIVYGATKADAASIGFDDEFILHELMTPIGNRTLETKQLLRDEAIEAFRHWQLKEDRVLY